MGMNFKTLSLCKKEERKIVAWIKNCEGKYITAKGVEGVYIDIDSKQQTKYYVFFPRRKTAPPSIYIAKGDRND